MRFNNKWDSREKREYNKIVHGVDTEMNLECPEIVQALKEDNWNGDIRTYKMSNTHKALVKEVFKRLGKEAPDDF